jgi:hypothetical protein
VDCQFHLRWFKGLRWIIVMSDMKTSSNLPGFTFNLHKFNTSSSKSNSSRQLNISTTCIHYHTHLKLPQNSPQSPHIILSIKICHFCFQISAFLLIISRILLPGAHNTLSIFQCWCLFTSFEWKAPARISQIQACKSLISSEFSWIFEANKNFHNILLIMTLQ